VITDHRRDEPDRDRRTRSSRGEAVVWVVIVLAAAYAVFLVILGLSR
jgi:hypothetical protein